MTAGYTGPERRSAMVQVTLSEEQIEEIAEKAAALAVQKTMDDMYKHVGKNVVQKFIWIVGVCAVGIYAFLKGKGIIS